MDQWIGPQNVTVVGLLIVAIFTGWKGMWQFRFQTEKELAAKDTIIAELKDQMEQQRRGSAERLEEMRADMIEWKTLAYDLSDLGKRAAAVAEKSVK